MVDRALEFRASGPTLVAGEAGIGKTRLLLAVAEHAETLGWRVVWGRSWTETEAPPCWPWTQIARQLRGASAGTDLARVVAGRVGADAVIDDAHDDDGEVLDRFELFDATAALVRAAAADGPLLVVLDDLHAADAPSLTLTRFVAQQLGDSPARLVAAHRTGDPRRPDAVRHLDALRQIGSEIVLGGLDLDAITALTGDPDTAETVLAATGGNPLFVEHVLRGAGDVGAGARRHGSATAAVAEPTTAALRTVLAERISYLCPTTRAALEALAARGGTGTTLDLAHVLDSGAATVEAALGELVAAGMAERRSADAYEAIHSLIVEVTLESTPADTARQLHQRAATLVAGDPDRLEQYVHHLLRAGPDHRAAAIRACRRAARAASVATAHEQAVLHLSQALAALDDEAGEAGTEALRTRLDLLLALGRAQRLADRIEEADVTFDEAGTLASQLDDAEGLALSALRGGIQYYFAADRSAERIEPCRDALARMPAADAPLRARLLADIGARLCLGTDIAAGQAKADEAVAMARRLNEPVALGHALLAQQVADLGPATLTRRLRTAREILALARRAGEPSLMLQGRFLLLGALVEHGDLRPLEAELAGDRWPSDHALDELADRTRARFGHWLGCTRALLDGEPDRAEEIAHRGLAVGLERGEPSALRVFGGQLGAVRRMQGRELELEGLYEEQRRLRPREAAWSAGLAMIRAVSGRPDAARAALDDVERADPIAPMHLLLVTTVCAEATAVVGDDALVVSYWERLLPFRDRFVPINVGAAAWGPVARPLGLLAARLDRPDEAIAHFERAVAVCARLGARPWLVEAQLDLADQLRQSNRTADWRGRELVAEAAGTAAQLGLTRFDVQIESLQQWSGGKVRPRRPPIDDVDRRPAIAVLGTFEVRSADGRVARWSSRKARELLKILVARRGAPVHREVLIDLLWPHSSSDSLANRLSVALSTVRRALDPDHDYPTGALVTAERDAVRLRIDHVDVDVERFLDLARQALRDDESASPDAEAMLRAAIAMHTGPALPDEPYSAWATGLQSEVQLAYLGALSRLSERTVARGDDLAAADLLRRLVDADPYDAATHQYLVATMERIGAVGLADQERKRFQAIMAS